MNTILITGAAGFIGHKTAELLLNQGYQIVGLDNMNNYYDNRLQELRLHLLQQYSNFTFYYADIKDRSKLSDIFSRHEFDAVIHLAAKAGVRESMTNPHIYLDTNTKGTLNILDNMIKHEVKKMVFASTSSIYAGMEVPFCEDMPANTPASNYAATKKAAEVLCNAYHQLYGLDVSIVRYFTVYGPAGRPDMSYFKFIRAIDEGKPLTIYGDGTQLRDFSYIDDIANGNICALKNINFEIFNLGGGNGTYSLLKLIEYIEKYIEKKAHIIYEPFEKADMKATWANIEKAKTLLNWQPTVSFETGIQKCVEWYLENKSWVSLIK
jgi:nucleoside-diphosphate-sugar epimerase